MLKNIFRCSITCLILISVVKSCACQGTVEVKLKHGLISGKVEKTFLNNNVYNAFMGIPYAEPPIGDLRFKPPKPHPGWNHLYEAFKIKPTCVQHDVRQRFGEKFGVSGSEDCLYLSVFTPSLQGSRAVLVFDYHDNYRTGFNGTRKFSAEFLTDEDVVVVYVSHRLGLMGYLTTEDDAIPPNNGLRDYILALKWVKDNIARFGGDPDRVTLMGCRGGGSLVNNLLYSKAAKGLFHAATIQGGTSHEAIYFPKNPKDFAFKLAEHLEIQAEDSTTLLKELQKVDHQKIFENEPKIVLDDLEYLEYQTNVYPFSPVIEKDSPEAIITTLPEKGKIVNDVPVLIGFNSREGIDLNSLMLFNPRITESTQTLVQFPIRTNFRFGRNNTAIEDFKDEVINFYLKHGYLHYANMLEYSVYVGDVFETYALNVAARKISADLESPTYFYMFDFYGNLNENLIFISKNINFPLENWGATVADEICYLHLCTRIRVNYEEHKKLVTEQNEFKVLRRMLRLWSNFAKTGDPTPDGEDSILKTFKWKPIDKTSDNLAFAHITKRLKMGLNPLGKREKFWNNILEKYSQMAVDGVVQKTSLIHEEL